MKGPVISLGSSYRIFASFFAHLISCSFWLRIPHAAMFKSVFESAPESTGKCQNLLCELESPLPGMFLTSLFGPCYRLNFWMLVVGCFRDVNAVFQARQSGRSSEGYLPPRRFEMVQYCVVLQKSCYIWMSGEF